MLDIQCGVEGGVHWEPMRTTNCPDFDTLDHSLEAPADDERSRKVNGTTCMSADYQRHSSMSYPDHWCSEVRMFLNTDYARCLLPEHSKAHGTNMRSLLPGGVSHFGIKSKMTQITAAHGDEKLDWC